jgi:diguanylate cyclase (GGDEF)-like protein
VSKVDDSDSAVVWHIRSEQQRHVQAQAEHLRLIFDHSLFVLLGNLAAGGTLVIGAWGNLPAGHLLAWFAAMLGLNLARWLASRRYPGGRLSTYQLRRWERRFLLSTLLSGLLWGIAGGWFFIPGNAGHNFFVTLLVISMAAAATTSHSYHRYSYPVFFLPAIAPLTVNLILEPSVAARAVGCVTPVYFALLYVMSRRIYAAAHSAITSRMNHQHLAFSDYLTDIANRRAFQEVLDKEWLRAHRTRHPLSLLVADIDDFKRINDSFGHAAGDQVLKALAQMIESRTRHGTDLVARIGGEEFGVILPETDLAGAVRLAEDIRQRAHQLAVDIGQEVTPNLTLSIGAACAIATEGSRSGQLLALADQALYEAKGRGKDQVRSRSLP